MRTVVFRKRRGELETSLLVCSALQFLLGKRLCVWTTRLFQFAERLFPSAKVASNRGATRFRVAERRFPQAERRELLAASLLQLAKRRLLLEAWLRLLAKRRSFFAMRRS
jgi:hypothetical protein